MVHSGSQTDAGRAHLSVTRSSKVEQLLHKSHNPTVPQQYSNDSNPCQHTLRFIRLALTLAPNLMGKEDIAMGREDWDGQLLKWGTTDSTYGIILGHSGRTG